MTPRFSIGLAVVSRKGMRLHHSGHPWIYRDDLVEFRDVPTHVCELVDESRTSLGYAASSSASKIALRFLGRESPGTTVSEREAWFARCIDTAIDARRDLETRTDAYRVIASEGDGLPGLIVDRYADVLVLQALTPFVDSQLDLIVPRLVERFESRMIVGRNDLRVRRIEGLSASVELLHGRRVASTLYRDDDLEFSVDPWSGQKTGAFLDQRVARQWVRRHARGRVLDLFCYEGAFSFHARRGGADSVLAVDSSERAIAEVEAGIERNGLDRIEARRSKVAPLLQSLADEDARFDLVICDPPAFAKSKGDLQRATRGYTELHGRAMRVVAPGGALVACSCSYALRDEAFGQLLATAARRTGRRFVDRGRLRVGEDHRLLLGHPEADYLKVHVLEAID
ncbi:MAG: class I SAM-dependent rRNA methyltransferase [Planctomycetes bacterium]|nr:class I SAM-dependent rRNA methyltransferase [Planctomycetota bacterium]MCB9918526.1 class I SAM-dependent rRNA methyltransferase [Planctomycetota bacterium]